MADTKEITLSDQQSKFLEKLKTAPLYQLILLPIDVLIPTDKNPNEIVDPDQFNALIRAMDQDKEFIKARPPIINTYPGREFRIIGGEKRWMAAQKLGWDKIPVILVKVEPSQEKDWTLKDNHHAGLINNILEKEILTDLQDSGYDLTNLSYAPTELVDSLEGFSDPEGDSKDDPEYTGTTPRKPKIKIAEGAEIECPECGHKWSFTVGYTSTPKDPKSDKVN